MAYSLTDVRRSRAAVASSAAGLAVATLGLLSLLLGLASSCLRLAALGFGLLTVTVEDLGSRLAAGLAARTPAPFTPRGAR